MKIDTPKWKVHETIWEHTKIHHFISCSYDWLSYSETNPAAVNDHFEWTIKGPLHGLLRSIYSVSYCGVGFGVIFDTFINLGVEIISGEKLYGKV